MTIETKYNLGDKVMFGEDGFYGTICSIRVDLSTLDDKYCRMVYEAEADKGGLFYWVKPEEIVGKLKAEVENDKQRTRKEN